MARWIRIVLPGFPHHVVLRGNNRRTLFSYPPDYGRFIWLLGGGLDKTGCQLHALALMTNHVHLVVTPPDKAALSALVKRVAQRYAQLRNLQRGASGKLFEQRYWSRPILSDEQLGVTTVYVDMNPVRAGLIADPLYYPWTTYTLHAGRGESADVPRGMWTPSVWYRALGRDREERARRYVQVAQSWHSTGKAPEEVTRVQLLEAASFYSPRRLERPDRTRANEPLERYGS